MFRCIMPYDQRYELDLLRGTEEPRPWDLLKIIREYTRKSDVLLDIGCGTAFKLIQLAGNVGKIYGLEPNEKMRTKAEENIRLIEFSNIALVNEHANEIPFKDNYFDVVTCMVVPHNTAEVYRVLKQNRYAILEKIGESDKLNFKKEFGFNEGGYRGQFSYLLGEGDGENIPERI